MPRVGSNPTSSSSLVHWSSGLSRLPVTEEIMGSNPIWTVDGSVAQLVEQRIEAPCVGGSIPSRATIMEG